MFIKRYLEKRKEKVIKKIFNEGFNYAAGKLLKGNSPLQLESIITLEFDNDPCARAFDYGILKAIDLAIEKKLVEDDRI